MPGRAKPDAAAMHTHPNPDPVDGPDARMRANSAAPDFGPNPPHGVASIAERRVNPVIGNGQGTGHAPTIRSAAHQQGASRPSRPLPHEAADLVNRIGARVGRSDHTDAVADAPGDCPMVAWLAHRTDPAGMAGNLCGPTW